MASILNGEYSSLKCKSNLYDYFKSNLNNCNNDDAVIYNDCKMTFRELDDCVIKISDYLCHEYGFKKSGLIGVHLKADLYLIPTLMAIHRLSCAYVPIDQDLPNDRIQHILNDAKIDFIITNSSGTDLDSLNTEIPIVNLNEILASKVEFESMENINKSSEDLACVLYTSGSTGKPKGVCLTHNAIMKRLHWQWETYPLVKGVDVGVKKTSLSFVDHIAEVFGFILKELPIVVVDTKDVSNVPRLIDILHQQKVTYITLVPSLLNNIINYVKFKNEFNKLSTVKRWICSGEALTYKMVENFINLNIKNSSLNNFYGCTEIPDVTYISFKSMKDLIQFKKSSIPLGKPLFNSTIELLDDDLKPVALGKIGEIYASGGCLMKGYLNQNINDERFIIHENRPKFRTGDYGYIENGMLFYKGRKDSQIKIRGKRVDLNEIACCALKLSSVEMFLPLIYDKSKIIGFYKTSTKGETTEDMVLNTLKNDLPEYMIPYKLFRLTDDVPYLYNGKIDRMKLIELYKSSTLNKRNNQVDDGTSDSLSSIVSIIEKTTNVMINSSDLERPLKDIGIDSLNILDVFIQLQNNGRNLDFDLFLSCQSLKELIEMRDCTTVTSVPTNRSKEFRERLKIIKFSEQNIAHDIFKLCAETFSEKSPLETSLSITAEQWYDEYYTIYDVLKDSEISFGVVDSITGKILGGVFACDIKTQFNWKYSNHFEKLDAVLNACEEEIYAKLVNKKEKILYSSLTCTSVDLSYDQNVILFGYMEDEIISIAKKENYEVVCTTNRNKLSQFISKELKGYKVLKSVQCNEFVFNGEKVFSDLPDSEILQFCVLYLNE